MRQEIIQNGSVPFPVLRRPARHPFGSRVACIACCGLLALGMAPEMARAQDAPGSAAAQAVLRTAAGILSYTRWPQQAQQEPELRLCVVGETEYADALLAASGQMLGQRRLRVERVALDDVAALQSCASLYVGNMPLDDWRALLRQLNGQALLTISEQAALCRVGAMFCLHRPDADATAGGEGGGAITIGFEVNLDSVTRSGLRVNPRVLQLARNKPAGAS